jgi:phospholipase/lecithinase/hemolysin
MTASLVLAVLLLAPALAGATSFKALYVFGDSLSDSGNAATSSPDFVPSPPYAGRFSNGPVAAEYLAGLMGVPGGPSLAGGTNFAMGGATTGTENYNYEASFPLPLPDVFAMTGMEVQIADALDPPAFNPSRTLFLVWGGPNDIFLALATGTNPFAVIPQAVANLASHVEALAHAGARYILVPNMGDLGATPFGAPQGRFFTQVTQDFNAALESSMADLERRRPGHVRISIFDTFAVQRQIMERPRLFGFTDTTSTCIADPTGPPACKGYLFFDPVHPTTAGHRILGVLLAASCARFGKSCFGGLGRGLIAP